MEVNKRRTKQENVTALFVDGGAGRFQRGVRSRQILGFSWESGGHRCIAFVCLSICRTVVLPMMCRPCRPVGGEGAAERASLPRGSFLNIFFKLNFIEVLS